MPTEPPPCVWGFPDPARADDAGVVAIGGDLEPSTVLAAYRSGLFPMHVDDGRVLAWWSPDPRAVLPLDGLRLSKSLRRSLRRYEVRIDSAFSAVVAGCADPDRPHGWINRDIAGAYEILFEMGWAHSVETWDGDELVGGLYGVGIGGFFAGESMFHRSTDASKVALVALVELLRADGRPRLLDVQWQTEHLASLGTIEVPRARYLELLGDALALPPPDWP